jgi:hypothetical protein
MDSDCKRRFALTVLQGVIEVYTQFLGQNLNDKHE